jgi:hypothetical protein
MQDEQLRKIVDHIFNAHPDNLMSCADCDCELHCLAEKVATGANLSDLWPEVEAHLDCCPECDEVFRALVCILRAENSGEIHAAEN